MTRIGKRTGAMSLALVLAGCGGGSPAPEGGEKKAAPSQAASASRAAVPADELVMAPSWQPAAGGRNGPGLGGKTHKADLDRIGAEIGMTRIGKRTGAMSLALVLAGCGGGSPAPEGGETKAAPSQTASASRAAVPADELVMPPSWMPADWDRNVHGLGGKPMKADTEREFRQRMVAVTPFILWAVANDTLVTEAFEPIWVWYTAIRSCERGIQMSEDLAGEFGDRARGKAALTQAQIGRAHV